MRFPEVYRVRRGVLASHTGDPGGAFMIPHGSHELGVIAASGDGWEHVSVSLPNRCPNWLEMCAVKALFWMPEDCVMQLHPPESEYIDQHPYCLHMWRPLEAELPRPPAYMVGTIPNDKQRTP